jgi:hypothetical protein
LTPDGAGGQALVTNLTVVLHSSGQ